jgi:ubiquinone/menaquinone biosynthesis C-methylase UbiE
MNALDAAASEYSPELIAKFFDEYGLREWNRLVETPVDEVSLYLHTHYLEQYFAAGMRVLEIGAGAGRFTQVLARLGARILVADISQGQLSLNRKFARELGFEKSVEDWKQLDVCDLSMFGDQSFQCVVAYGGVFSYVLDRRDTALSECLRVLKPGGLLLASVMTLWGGAHANLDGVISLPAEVNQRITGTGDLTPATYPGRKDRFMHLFRAGEFRTWLEQAGVEILAMSAAGCLSIRWMELLRSFREDELKWQELLRMELEASAEAESLNLGTHLISVVRKGFDHGK